MISHSAVPKLRSAGMLAAAQSNPNQPENANRLVASAKNFATPRLELHAMINGAKGRVFRASIWSLSANCLIAVALKISKVSVSVNQNAQEIRILVLAVIRKGVEDPVAYASSPKCLVNKVTVKECASPPINAEKMGMGNFYATQMDVEAPIVPVLVRLVMMRRSLVHQSVNFTHQR